MSLDFTPLGNAIQQLETSLCYATSDTAKADLSLFEQLRNSTCHCFKFTYELSHKMLKRYLEETTANPEEFDLATFQNIIRTGNEKQLLRSDWLRRKDYRQARTNSSHTYDQEKAAQVYAIAPDFLEEARHLHQQLIARSRRE